MSGKGDKEKETGGGLSETPPVKASVASDTAPEFIVSGALREKVNLLIPEKNTAQRDRTLKALKAGKVVHIGVHKLKADKAPDKKDDSQ